MAWEDGDFDRHSLDPLKNLSFYKAQCRCCGRWYRESTDQDRAVVWIACECGHVMRAENRVRWH